MREKALDARRSGRCYKQTGASPNIYASHGGQEKKRVGRKWAHTRGKTELGPAANDK